MSESPQRRRSMPAIAIHALCVGLVANLGESRRAMWAFASLATFTALIVFSSGPAPMRTLDFRADAGSYWSMSQALMSGGVQSASDLFAFHGVLAGSIYIPAAIVGVIWGQSPAAWAVLIENSVGIGVLGGVIVPLLIRRLSTLKVAHGLIAAIAVGVGLRGFGAYPLMDLWSAVAVLSAILFISSPRRWSLALAGALLAAAVNLRPASAAPAIGLVVVCLAAHRARAGYVLAGAAIASVPQTLLNLFAFRSPAMWALGTSELSRIQAGFGAYTTRYDTYPSPEGWLAGQLFCSPTMAGHYLTASPDSILALAISYVRWLPDSLVLITQKLAASVLWEPATPYSAGATGPHNFEPYVTAAIFAAGVVLGAFGMVRNFQRRSPYRSTGRALDGRETRASVGVVLATSMITIGISAPETRFALITLTTSIIIILASPLELIAASKLVRGAIIASTLVALALTLTAGFSVFQHPAASTPISAAVCYAS